MTTPPASAPTITSITPDSGAASTAVVIVGTNFVASGLVVTVGGVSISPNLINSTRIEGITGAHADGAVDVYVETVNGNDTLAGGYTYTTAGEGEPTDPGSGYLWEDDFDRYASSTAMMACPPNQYTTEAPYFTSTVPNHATCGDPAASKYQLTTGRGGSGNALRSVYAADPSHNQQSLAWLSPWWGTGIDFGYSFVVRFWMRIGNGQSYAPLGGKFFEAFWASGASGRIQWGHGATANRWHWVLGDNAGPAQFDRCFQPVGPYWYDLNDGTTWVQVTLLFKANTSSSYVSNSGETWGSNNYTGTSSQDGRVAMWVQGTKIMDCSQDTVGVTPPGGENPWCYQSDVDSIPGQSGTNSIGGCQSFQFPEVANGTDDGLTIDHDDLKVWAGA